MDRLTGEDRHKFAAQFEMPFSRRKVRAIGLNIQPIAIGGLTDNYASVGNSSSISIGNTLAI